MPDKDQLSCWLCHSNSIQLIKEANYKTINASDFCVTDCKYGTTASIYQCLDCSFLFCPHIPNPDIFYQEMVDDDYEKTRQHRAIQLKHLLNIITPYTRGKTLFDIGAGSGILVEEAINQGYQASGIEASTHLASIARNHNLPVINGFFPNDEMDDSYDIITLIDIIEHVTSPLEILTTVTKKLEPTGICAIVTPNVDSIAAKIMGDRWWHFRLAHVGYFSNKTLKDLIKKSGLEVIYKCRPGWYFPADYLYERGLEYLPKILKHKPPQFLSRLSLPLNLGDSIMYICQAKAEKNGQ